MTVQPSFRLKKARIARIWLFVPLFVNVTDEGLSVGTDPVFVIAVGFMNDPNSHVCHLTDDDRHCIR